MKGYEKYNTQMPPKPSTGGGSAKPRQKPNGDQSMPTPKVDPYVAWKGEGGAKNGKVKGV